MHLQLTDEERRALEKQPAPVRVIDEQTNTPYVLIREDLYQRVRAVFEEGRTDPGALPAGYRPPPTRATFNSSGN
jgi:hypothetical protein